MRLNVWRSEIKRGVRGTPEFCKEFDVPEAQNCMKMLHAVAEMGTGDAVTQMNHLIMHVNEMQNRAEEIRNGKIAFRQKMIFSYPVIAATVKLLIDLDKAE